jgi:esterase/lipase
VVSPTDRVVDGAAARRFFASAGSARKELVVASDAGHVIPLDSGWERAAEAAERFIRSAGAAAVDSAPAARDATPMP